jgi:uncharacterized protein YbjT (DUF2867 family)
MEQRDKPSNNPKKTAIVAGASGLTGGFLLDVLARDKTFGRIIVLSRKAVKPAQPKVKEIIVDFSKLDKYDFWSDAHVLFCCIGTTIKKAGSRENFRKVDFDIPVKLAEQCALYNIGYHLISSTGADAASRNFYLRTKGETEEALKTLGLPSLSIYRPSMLFGPRKENRPGESFGKIIMYLAHPLMLGPLKKYRGIHAYSVAKGMVNHAKSSPEGVHIFESEEIKKLAKTNP